jgi:plastocyanin
MKKFAIVIAALALAPVGVAACGGGSDSSSTTPASTDSASGATTPASGSGGGATVTFEADPSGQLAFTQTDVTAAAGNDTIKFDNPASLTHDVVIEDSSGNEIASTDTVSAGTATAQADLKPGTYTFFCSVDSHRAAGMEGTLTVN